MKPSSRRVSVGALVLAILFLVFYCRQRQPGTSRNLIVNGDAEAGPGSSDTTLVASIPAWATTGHFNVIRYGASGGFPSPLDAGPTERGNNFFGGGANDALSTATQTIDVSSRAAAIDKHALACRLSGYLGGYENQADNASLIAEFQGADSAKLGDLAIGPVMPAERHGATSLLLREATAPVPARTRKIVVTLKMVRHEGSNNDGYADNLSLVLLPAK